MSEPEYRALVVDDESAVRQLTMRALSREGFFCAGAANGNEALSQLGDSGFDVVVTDLRMPDKHGHALAVELLARQKRPLVVVLTGVAEPRLAKDLVGRGVDDIMFKPVNYQVLAAKIKALLYRRLDGNRGLGGNGNVVSGDPEDGEPLGGASGRKPLAPITLEDLDAKVPQVGRILPVSQAAIDVFNMANSDDFEGAQIVKAVSLDPSLAAEVLRLSNSSFYNPSGQRIVELDEATTRLGSRRVGELALATNAMTAFSQAVLSWMDTGLAWRRSVAAGLAVELLAAQGGHSSQKNGLLVCAIMHAMGRVVLGTLYPDNYEAMIQYCRQRRMALSDLERAILPISHTEVVARLLESWKIPADICVPLKHITSDYAEVAKLSEPTRTKTELVKLARLIARSILPAWEPWDSIDLPPPSVIERLGIHSIPAVMEQTRSDLEMIENVSNDGQRPAAPSALQQIAAAPSHRVAYCNVSAQPFDFVAAILSSTGIRLIASPIDICQAEATVLVNAVDVPPDQLIERIGGETQGRLTVISNAEYWSDYSKLGQFVPMDGSYEAFHAACLDALKPAQVN